MSKITVGTFHINRLIFFDKHSNITTCEDAAVNIKDLSNDMIELYHKKQYDFIKLTTNGYHIIKYKDLIKQAKGDSDEESN